MNDDRKAVAQVCLNASYDGSLSFPQIVCTLIAAGFEGYAVEYRRKSQIFYLPDGQSVDLAIPLTSGSVAEAFDAATVAALVRWAQADAPDYSYAIFNEKAMAAGCAGYYVSFLGLRVVYYGRTGETHVELFPS